MPAADAALILRDLRYPKQTRDLTLAGKKHINVLSDMMRRRQWRDWEKIDFARCGDKLVIINGHHRLGAQAASGARIKWIFVIHECASEEAVAALYYTFDTNVKPRTTEQILSVIGAAELLGVNKTTVTAVYGSVPLIMADFDFGRSADDSMIRRMADLRMEKVKALQGEAIAWEKATKKAPQMVRRRLITQGALAVALMCFKHQSTLAQSFWSGVSDDDGLMTGDARKTYLKYLLNNTGGGGSSYAIATATALAWNAWYDQRELRIIKMVADARFRIAGTPIGR
jgi:hypothetical protein